jgi:hypothetical protein
MRSIGGSVGTVANSRRAHVLFKVAGHLAMRSAPTKFAAIVVKGLLAASATELAAYDRKA